MKLITLSLLFVSCFLPTSSPAAADPATPAPELAITCLIHKQGDNLLTEEKFSVPANRETVLFRDGERLYGAGYYLDADYYNPGHSALELWIVSDKSRARYSARTTWAPAEKFNQLRVDVEHHDGGGSKIKEFFLCSDR